MIRNNHGVTLFELLISISVGSVVIVMLLSIMTGVMTTRNHIEYDNKLLDESYFISEFIQAKVFDLGVRSVEDIGTDIEGKQILKLSHEYELAQDEDGRIYRDYSNRRSDILLYDEATESIYYGPDEEGVWDSETHSFINPVEFRLNASNIRVIEGSIIEHVCFEQAQFENEEWRCYSAIITINITLTMTLESGSTIYHPKAFQTTIIF